MFKGLLDPECQQQRSEPKPALKSVKLAKALSLAATALGAMPPEKRKQLLAVKAAKPAAGLLEALGIVVSSVHVNPSDVSEIITGVLGLLDPQTAALLGPLVPLIDANAVADRINNQLVGPLEVALRGGDPNDANS